MKRLQTQTDRIIAIDILRALAVILMVEGHTVHVFLRNDFRNHASAAYNLWIWMRGFTAPLFMFVSGLIFTYLLLDDNLRLKSERFGKGIGRGLFLLALGYLLRFPSFNPFRLARVSREQWLTFISVDALHVIGLGIISVALFTRAFEYFGANRKLFTGYVAALFSAFALGYFLQSGDVVRSLPDFLAAYFVYDFGSVFTLFPWLGYLFLGAAVSVTLKKRENEFPVFRLAAAAFAVFFVATVTYRILFGETYFSIIAERASFVTALFFVIFLQAKNKKSASPVLTALGKNTLLIYAVHLVVLYGSPASLGFYQLFPHSLSVAETVIAVLLMEGIMFYIAMLKEKNTATLNFYGLKKLYGKIG